MKKKLKQATSLTLATTITLASCSPNGTYLFHSDEMQEETKKDVDTINLLEKCVVELTPEDQQIMDYYIGLIDELMNDSKKAKAFIDSPQNFLSEQANTYEGELDEGIIEIIKVLAYEDVKEAIRNKDFKTFTALCKKYDIISIPKIVRDTLEVISDKRLIKKIVTNANMDEYATVNHSLNEVSPVYCACLLVFVGVVAIALAEVAVSVDFISSGNSTLMSKAPQQNLQNSNTSFIEQSKDMRITPSALIFYKLKSKEDINLYTNDWVEQQYQLIDNFLMQNNVNYTNNESYRTSIQQIIKGLLLQNYFI